MAKLSIIAMAPKNNQPNSESDKSSSMHSTAQAKNLLTNLRRLKMPLNIFRESHCKN